MSEPVSKFEQLKQLIQQETEAAKQKFGSESIKYAKKLAKLAHEYIRYNQYLNAVSLLEESLILYKELLGLEHPDTLLVINSLTYVYEKQGKYEQAESLYLQVLSTRDNVTKENHFYYTKLLDDLAYMYEDLDRYDEIPPLLEEIINIKKKYLGAKHGSTDYSITRYECYLNNRIDFYKSKELYKEATATKKLIDSLK